MLKSYPKSTLSFVNTVMYRFTEQHLYTNKIARLRSREVADNNKSSWSSEQRDEEEFYSRQGKLDFHSGIFFLRPL